MIYNDTSKINFNIGMLWLLLSIVTAGWLITYTTSSSEIRTLRGQVLVVAQSVNRQTEINKRLLEVIKLHQTELEKLSQQ